MNYNTTTNDSKTNDQSKNDRYEVTAVDPAEGQSIDLGESVTLTVTHYVYEAAPTASPTPGSSLVPSPSKTPQKDKDKDNDGGND